MTSRRCVALRADGSPCRAWAVRGSVRPLCSVHGGAEDRGGGQPGNMNALKHGYYQPLHVSGDCTIDAIIGQLYQRQLRLDDYIDEVEDAASIEEISHLLRIFGQNASRLGRLLRDRRALSGDAADGISGAIAQALAELETELGTPLT
jgi:hypothetical protein